MSDDGPGRPVATTAFVMPVIPAALNVDPVLAGLLHCMAFLALSGDDAVDPDWAVEAMEHVAHYMQRLGAPIAERIRQQLATVAEHWRDHGHSDQLVEFAGRFLDNCGLSEASQ